jgi:hypothetical protein
VNYAWGYKLANGLAFFKMDFEEEWLWEFILLTCKQSGFTVNMWFLIVEIGYLGFVFLGLRKLLHENPWMAMLFFLSAFSTFTFGVNGIRNGLACSMVIFAFAIAANKGVGQLILAGIVMVLAFGIHRSTALPIIAFFAASYLIKSPKFAIGFWVASIGLSLVLGDYFTNFFMGLGFDDRMTSYGSSMDKYKDSFSNAGFRWDFLLYSFFPILMIWYVCIKRQIVDYWYNVLAITYCLCNAFWVMVITASFSNRFAYLSWFMYPVIIAYPLINLPVWDDQDRKTGLILLAYCGFTLFMNVFVWGV